jgi:hypothetical protein
LNAWQVFNAGHGRSMYQQVSCRTLEASLACYQSTPTALCKHDVAHQAQNEDVKAGKPYKGFANKML